METVTNFLVFSSVVLCLLGIIRAIKERNKLEIIILLLWIVIVQLFAIMFRLDDFVKIIKIAVVGS